MKGQVLEILQLKDNKFRVSLDIVGCEDLNNVSKLKDKKEICSIEIKKHRAKRSLSANAYCWVLLEKIAEKLALAKEDVYRTMLERYGTIESDENGKIIFSVKKEIVVSKYFKYFKELGLSKDGKFKHYYVIKGSSEYDALEMKKFVDGIIQECKSLGIETLTPEEIAQMELN